VEFVLVAGEATNKYRHEFIQACNGAARLASVDGPFSFINGPGYLVAGCKALAVASDHYFWDGHGVGESQAFSSGTCAVPSVSGMAQYFASSITGAPECDMRGVFTCLRVNGESGDYAVVLDPLFQYPLFVYKHNGLLIASNNIYVIESLALALGQKLTRNPDVGCFEVACGIGAGTKSGFKEVSMLPYGSMITGQGARWEITGSQFQAVPRGLTYTELLDRGADRLINYMKALDRAAINGALLFDLTGGQDSRICFAAAVGAGIKNITIFTGGDDEDDDLYVARQIAKQYGAYEGNFPENFTEDFMSANEMARRATFYQQGHSTLYHYALGKARLNTVIRVRGGGGEILRSHLEPVSTGNLFCDQPARFVQRFVKGELRYRQALSSYWSKVFDKNSRFAARWAFATSAGFSGQLKLYTPEFKVSAVRSLARDFGNHADSVGSMGMDLYLKDRTRRHFSYLTRGLNLSSGAFEPLFDPYLLAAAEALSWEERESGRLVFDLMEKLAGPEIFKTPFAPKSMQSNPRAYLSGKLQLNPSEITAVDRREMLILPKRKIPTVGQLDQWAEFDGPAALGNHGKYLWQNRKYLRELAGGLPINHGCWDLLNRDGFMAAVNSDDYFFTSNKISTRGLRFLHMFVWLNEAESRVGISELV